MPSNDFMKQSTQENDSFAYPPEIPTDRPTAARSYGIPLGSKDHFEVDRQAGMALAGRFPEGLDIARQNRPFPHHAVPFPPTRLQLPQLPHRMGPSSTRKRAHGGVLRKP